jgi:hypothetical protein
VHSSVGHTTSFNGTVDRPTKIKAKAPTEKRYANSKEQPREKDTHHYRASRPVAALWITTRRLPQQLREH